MNTHPPLVTILLSTYNGERFLSEQIESIIGQSFSNWVLVVRDDNSSDSTRAIISKYAETDSRITLFNSGTRENLGAARSFLTLLSSVDTPYFMFCDQDDLWLPKKIENTLSKFNNDNEPQAVFTDVSVVDRELHSISDSFMRYSRLDPIKGTTLNHAAFQNVVIGCTFAGNRELLTTSRALNQDLPRDVVMHDWWMALVAICFGHLFYLDEPTVLYRQHGKNELGAKPSGLFNYFRLLSQGRPWEHAQNYLQKVSAQAAVFLSFYFNDLQPFQRKVFERVASLHRNPSSVRLASNFIFGIRMHKLDRNIALFISILLPHTPKKQS